MKFDEIPFPCHYNENFKLRLYYDLPDLKYAIVLHLNILPGYATIDSDVDMIPVRIHSACLTGDAFHSLKCDCGDQLDYSLKYISNKGRGMLIYLPQEGRGIGLVNKIQAYKLQLQGLTTFEANKQLGFKEDSRKYDICLDILKDFIVRNVEMLTSNPSKYRMFQRSPYIRSFKTKKIPVIENKHNRKYLEDKRLFFAKL